jgi:hypothetical protein
MTHRTVVTVTAGLAAALLAAGCSRATDTSSTEAIVSQVEVPRQAPPERPPAVTPTPAPSLPGAAQATPAGKDIVEGAENKVEDARITTSINAELGRDKDLSAMQINVDTKGGRVLLRGAAPNDVAADRASQLASAVEGVISVDNQLRVDPRKR